MADKGETFDDSRGAKKSKRKRKNRRSRAYGENSLPHGSADVTEDSAAMGSESPDEEVPQSFHIEPESSHSDAVQESETPEAERADVREPETPEAERVEDLQQHASEANHQDDADNTDMNNDADIEEIVNDENVHKSWGEEVEAQMLSGEWPDDPYYQDMEGNVDYQAEYGDYMPCLIRSSFEKYIK